MRIQYALQFVLVVFSTCLFAPSARCQNPDSLKLILETSSGKDKVKILNQLYAALSQVDPVTASAYNKEALSLATEIKDSLGMAKATNNLGHIYSNHGALDKALEFYLKAEDIFIRLNNQEGMAASRSNIGTIYSYKKDLTRSNQYFQDAQAVFASLKDTFRLAGVLGNLGNNALLQGEKDKAIEYFGQAKQLGEKANKPSPTPLIGVGNVYLSQANAPAAIEAFQAAGKLAEAEDDKESLLTIYTGLGKALLMAGDARASEEALNQALAWSEEVEAYILEPEIFKSLSATYAKQGKMKEAYTMLEKYEEGRERYFNEESSRRIAQMEMLIQIHEKEKELEALRRDEALQKVELQRTQLAIILIVISLLLIALLLNIFMQKRKPRKR